MEPDLSKKPIVILDTSTVFNLGHRGQLGELTAKICQDMELWVTPQVVREISSIVAQQYYQRFIEPLVEVRSVQKNPLSTQQIEELNDVIHGGEISVIALAMEHQATACLDEKPARRIAQKLGVPVIGTLGLLIHALKKGYFTDTECLKAIHRMKAGDFRIPAPEPGETFQAYVAKF